MEASRREEETFKTNSPKARYSPLIKAGFLSKKGGERRNWNKRWFELRSHTLSYYNSRKADVLKGEISLFNCVVEEQEYEAHSFVFILKSANRTYYISAFSEIEMTSWINSINKCIKSLEGEMEIPPKPITNTITNSSAISILSRSLSSKNIWSKKVIHHNNNNNNNNSPNTQSHNNNNKEDCNKVTSSPPSVRLDHANDCSKGEKYAKFELPNDLNVYSRDQLIDLINHLFLEQQNSANELEVLKHKAGDVVLAMQTQLLSLNTENKQIQKELLLKDANIRKMQLRIVEANQKVVDAIPIQETTGRARAHTIMKMLNESGVIES